MRISENQVRRKTPGGILTAWRLLPLKWHRDSERGWPGIDQYSHRTKLGERAHARFKVTQMGQVSLPFRGMPSSHESANSKSVAVTFKFRVSSALCCWFISSAISTSDRVCRNSTLCVRGTRKSHKADFAAINSASYMFPVSESTSRSIWSAHDFLPGMMVKSGGCRVG